MTFLKPVTVGTRRGLALFAFSWWGFHFARRVEEELIRRVARSSRRGVWKKRGGKEEEKEKERREKWVRSEIAEVEWRRVVSDGRRRKLQ